MPAPQSIWCTGRSQSLLAGCWELGNSHNITYGTWTLRPKPTELGQSQCSRRIGHPLTVLCEVLGTHFSTHHCKQSRTSGNWGTQGYHGIECKAEKSMGSMNVDSREKLSVKRKGSKRFRATHQLSNIPFLLFFLPNGQASQLPSTTTIFFCWPSFPFSSPLPSPQRSCSLFKLLVPMQTSQPLTILDLD